MKNLILFSLITFLVSGCGIISSDLIDGFSLVILWNTSSAFKALCITVLWFVATKYAWIPIFKAVLPRLDDRFTWFGKDSDLIDKPLFFISSFIAGFLGIWAIKLLFIAIFMN